MTPLPNPLPAALRFAGRGGRSSLAIPGHLTPMGLGGVVRGALETPEVYAAPMGRFISLGATSTTSNQRMWKASAPKV